MKSKDGDYSLLKKKIGKKVLLVAFLSLIIFLFVNSLVSGRFGDFVVDGLVETFYLDYENAYTIYTKLFRKNKFLIMAISISILVYILLNLVLKNLTKYLDEVTRGLDSMSEDTEREIVLSKELQFIENKMNKTRGILLDRQKQIKFEEDRKNDLVLYLAHDLKTPLTSIIGYLSLLSEVEDMDESSRKKYTNITLDKANRLENLINEFFEITRFNMNKIVLYKENINLRLMFEQIGEELYPSMIGNGNQLVLDIDEGLELVGDGEKLARVFNNLLKNAVNYSIKNTEISISARAYESKVIIDIENQGEDISKKDLENIFNMFYRLDKSRSTKTGGSGLGLAIAKEIIEAHGGSILANSQNGRIRFKIEIPN